MIHGIVKKVGKSSLLVLDQRDDQPRRWDIHPKAIITLNGKAAKLEDICEGDFVSINGDEPYNSVRAESRTY